MINAQLPSSPPPLTPVVPPAPPVSPAPATSPAPQDSYVDSYQPPTAVPAPTLTTAPTSPEPKFTPKPAAPVTPPVSPVSPTSDSLEDQNIFDLLGAQKGTDSEKEAFLDELQQVVWEDFVQNDAELLITQEEQAGLEELAAKGTSEAVQEEMIVYLEKLIPDLEEIMMEKALLLKADLVKERIGGMREYYVGKAEVLAQIDEAETLVSQDQWHQAAQVLNKIS